MVDTQTQNQDPKQDPTKNTQQGQQDVNTQQAPQTQQPQPGQQGQEQQQGIPQGRFNEVYGKMRAAEEEATRVKQENVLLKSSIMGGMTPQPGIVQKQPAPSQAQGQQESREQKTEMSKQEWNDWNEEDPYAANEWLVKRRVEKEKQGIIANGQKQDFTRDKLASVDVVRQKHPDLFNADGSINATSEKFAVYNQVATEMPQLLDMSKGPELAMLEMERRIAAKGGLQVGQNKDTQNKDTQPNTNQSFQQGVAAQQKTAANTQQGYTAAPTGQQAQQPQNQSPLRPDEKAVAAKFGISEDKYKQNKGTPRRAPTNVKVDYS